MTQFILNFMLTAAAIKHFPASPGVYLMKDDTGRIIYVGKALNLRKRVGSYFTGSGDSRYQIRFLMNRVAGVDWIVTDTEKEALILENSLIKEHRPRYNLSLRDDKTYFSLRLDQTEKFPRITIIRKVLQDGARYFGPYASATAAREVLKEICRLFPLRHYPLKNCLQRKRPCLYYQLKQCSAPCFGKITPAEYTALVEGAALFLAGRSDEIARIFRKRMTAAAAREEYEEAARCRDLLNSIEKTVEKQKVVSSGGDADVIGIASQGESLHVCILFIRHGTLLGSRNYHFTWELDEAEAIDSFLAAYYSREVILPDEILLPAAAAEYTALAELLSERKGRRVAILQPKRGDKYQLLQMAEKNAVNAAAEHLKKTAESGAILEELKELLHLGKTPRRIECYDISNIQGLNAVGSQVSFVAAKPDKANYRRYRIKTVAQADDFAMMREVLSRRFRDGVTDDSPDLIIVDGGVGQLGILSAVLQELGIDGIDLAGLAKSRVETDVSATALQRSEERIFRPGRKNPVLLRQNSPALLLLTRIRDEAHRFAIDYHRNLRGKAALHSALDRISGIGAVLRKRLLERFGSVPGIREASAEQLAAVQGVTRELVARIQQELQAED
jgi:excinuclease ABC subunit C